MKKILHATCLFFIISGMYAQNVNRYKYVIVPKKFEALKDTNQYQLNSLTRLLFEDSGFTAVYEDQLPEALQKNNCLGLKASLANLSGMFTTKLKMVLKDCKNRIVFTSSEGKSREKEFKKGYRDALRNTFVSIKALEYRYEPEQTEEVVEPSNRSPIQVVEATAAPKQEPQITDKNAILYAQPIPHGFQLIDSSPKVVYILQKTSRDEVYIFKDKRGIVYKEGTQWIVEYYRDEILIKERITIKF